MGEQGIKALGHRPGADQTGHLQAPSRIRWTAEWDALLVELWNAGGTLVSVAKDMTDAGFPVSFSAISGRRNRLGYAVPRGMTPPPRPKKRGPVTHWLGVEYIDNSEDGCKAVLETRGESGLRKCCGRLRALTDKGNLSPYCDHHTTTYRPLPMRKADGESSQNRKH
jgi:hypothetical protein